MISTQTCKRFKLSHYLVLYYDNLQLKQIFIIGLRLNKLEIVKEVFGLGKKNAYLCLTLLEVLYIFTFYSIFLILQQLNNMS